MKKRFSASNIMRVVSILGILCLLALQWVWWRNAYRAVEMDFLRTTQECIKQSSSKALLNQLDDTKKGLRFVYTSNGDTSILKKAKVKYVPHVANNAYEMDYLIEGMLCYTNKMIKDSTLDAALVNSLHDKFGYIPKHQLTIHRINIDIDSLTRLKYNRIAIGKSIDTIYHQIGFRAYTTTTLPSPVSYYIKKGGIILLLSLLLVGLVGVVLIMQYLSMLRERRFSKFIKDYTRMITHDLRTPVNGIQMVFQLIDQLNPSEGRMRSDYVQEGIHLTKKVNLNLENILYMALSEQRKLKVQWNELDIKPFVENIVNSYRARNYNPKVVRIETNYEPADFKCHFDVKLMENALCNLLENAIKYTGEDARIVVTCSLVGSMVEIKVKDNGMGIKDSELKYIFNLFERGTENKDHDYPGFGIGLHFVERVVSAHRGKITVQSKLGEGTEFTIKYTSKQVS